MLRSAFFAAAVLATSVLAQTHTDCNPLNVTCPSDMALGIANYTWDLSSATDIDQTVWNNTGGLPIDVGSGMANFTISQSGNSPEIMSSFYFFFGTATVMLRTAPGTGIISAITLLSDDLDEVDWEFKGSNSTNVFTNFYGKYYGQAGNGTNPTTSFDPRADFHNYTINWSNTTIEWIIDGGVVRTLTRDDPACGPDGTHFPQTPMRLHIGAWAGGDSKEVEGTRQWAGGDTDYSKGPFTMSVSHVSVSDASTGMNYTYGDNSGSSQSIKIVPGQSKIAAYLADPKSASSTSSGGSEDGSIVQDAQAKFSGLSTGAKIGIACGVLGFVLIVILSLVVCCIKQRKAGRAERAIADAEFSKQEAEVMAFRQAQAHARRPGQMPGFGYQDFKGRR